eukprot:tig00020553_g10733.t2
MCLCPSNCALRDGGRRKNHSCRTTEVYTVHNTSSSRVVLDQAALKAKPEKETEMLGPRTQGCGNIDPPICGSEARPLHVASSGSSTSSLELLPGARGKASARHVERQLDERPAALRDKQEARPPHAASSGNSASGLELRPARLRGKASARRVERQLGERPRASPRPASRQGLRTPRRAATRRAASSFAPPGFEATPPHAASSSRSASGLELPPARARNKASARRAERQLGERPRDSPRPASRQDSCTPSRAAARRTASSLAPPGYVTKSLIMKNPDAYTHLQEEDQDERQGLGTPRRAAARRAASSLGPPIFASHPTPPRPAPPRRHAALRDAQDARPPHAESSGSLATGLELPPARDRGKASARRVERQLGERPRASLRPASRQGIRTPRRAAARRAASSFPPPGIETRPLHAASNGSSASSLELSSALLRGKASARRVERQLGERPRASPARDRGKASARRVKRQLGEQPRASPRPASGSPREGEDGVLHDGDPL